MSGPERAYVAGGRRVHSVIRRDNASRVQGWTAYDTACGMRYPWRDLTFAARMPVNCKHCLRASGVVGATDE